MRQIVHISDIHFGKTDSRVVGRLVEKINEIAPDLVVVSGDLTQRARKEQFAEARRFLDQIPVPQIVVPGNHDVPLYNILRRFGSPLANYKRFITSDMFPFFVDGELAVLGINTARSLTIKGGRVGKEQVAVIRESFCGLDETLAKIIVTHHPFDLPGGFDEDDIVGRAEDFMPQIAESGAEIFLSGHLHVSSITNSAHRYRLESGRSALIIQAGTAASTRGRGEPNSFNLVEIDRPFLTVKRFECLIESSGGFTLATSEQFTQTERGWSRM
ncbi:MAG: metallophosphoesterase family protein [Pyrinomonadaceae bacterium]